MKEQEDVRSARQEKYGENFGSFLDDRVLAEYDKASVEGKKDILKDYCVKVVGYMYLDGEEDEKKRQAGQKKEELTKQLVEKPFFQPFLNQIAESKLTGETLASDDGVSLMFSVLEKPISNEKTMDTVGESVVNHKLITLPLFISSHTGERENIIELFEEDNNELDNSDNLNLNDSFENIDNSKQEIKEEIKEEIEKEIEKDIKAEIKEDIKKDSKEEIKPQKDQIKGELSYSTAMKKFVEKRASIFTQESPEHKELREKAEAMMGVRKDNEAAKGTLKDKFATMEDKQAKMELAKKWLIAAHEMRDAAKTYMALKDYPFILTPAGRERYRGAKDLRMIAKAEINQCRQSLKELNDPELTVEKVYAAIREDKLNGAMEAVDAIAQKGKEPSKDEKDLLRDAVYTFVGDICARATAEEGATPLQSNILKMTRFTKHNPTIALAIQNYVSMSDPKDIQNDLSLLAKNPEKVGPKFMKKLENYKDDFTHNIKFNLVKEVPKNKAPKDPNKAPENKRITL